MSDIAVIPDHGEVMRMLVDALMADMDGVGEANVAAPTPGESPLPAAQAYVFDGAADQTEGTFVVDVAFYASSYSVASRLSRTFDARFMGYPHRVSSGDSTVLLDRVETNVIPNEVPFTEDDSVRRFQATYSVSFRRR
jgi:hypothetical protein